MQEQKLSAPATDSSKCASVLVVCFNHMLPALDGVDNSIGIGGPDEGFWVPVGLGDEAFDCCLKIDDRVEDAAFEASPGKLGEEALDGVQPGARRRYEVEGPAGLARQPLSDLGMLVRGIVVEDHVNDFASRHFGLDGIEKTNEFLMPMALHTATDHRAVENVEGGEQSRRAVALVIVRERAQTSGFHRQTGLGAIQRLDLRFLINREHDGMSRWVDVEANDVPKLAGEVDVIRQLEGADPMGHETMGFPDPVHARRTDADGVGHHPHSPMGRLTRRLRHGEIEHALHCISGHWRFARPSGLVAQKTINALMHEALLPTPDIGLRQAGATNDLVRAEAIRCRQDDLRAGDMLLSTIAVADDPLETTASIRRNGDADPCSHPGTISRSRSNGNPVIETIH